MNQILYAEESRPMKRARILSFINLKGGVAKTTTTVGTATALAERYHKRVLVIDMDPQTNATVMLIGDEKWQQLDAAGHTLFTLFEENLFPGKKGTFSLPDTIQKGVGNIKNVDGLDLLPSSIRMIRIQDRLFEIERKTDFGEKAWEVLRSAVEELVRYYDYVLIDCPPNLGILTQNALYISDYFIIPSVPDILSTYGITEILKELSDVSQQWSKEVICLGIVATKVKSGSQLHQRKLRDFEEGIYNVPSFHTQFPENNKYAEAAEYQNASLTLRQKWGYSRQAQLFYEFAKEIINKTEEDQDE